MEGNICHALTDENWAHSLVGREWEIFWCDDDGGDADTAEAAHDQVSENNDAPTPPGVGDENKDGHKDEFEENTDEDTDEDTDWYEARVIAATKRDEKGFWFRVMFAGDDTVYEMTLIPSVVRASSRAWTKRSMALLSRTQDSTNRNGERSIVDVAVWEKDLPIASLDITDLKNIEEIRKGLFSDGSLVGDRPIDLCVRNGSSDAQIPSLIERDEMLHLIFLLRVQIYLRSKLAPIREHKGKVRKDNGEIIPTEAYLDFLVNCLEELEKGSCWYCKCWSFHHKVLPLAETGVTTGAKPSALSLPNSMPPPVYQQSVSRRQSSNNSYSSTPLPPPTPSQQNVQRTTQPESVPNDSSISDSNHDIKFVSHNCLEKGSDIIIGLCNMDLSADGASKRAAPAPTGTRRTKRRKIVQGGGPAIAWEVGSKESGDLGSDDERGFGRLSSESLRRFVNHTQQTDHRWYVNYMARMLLNVCDYLYDPIKNWKLLAESILGESFKKDKDESDEESSEDGDSQDGEMEQVDQESEETACGDKFYTSDDVRSCIDLATNDRLLSRFDLSTWTSRLREKLDGISSFEATGWKLVSRVLDFGEATTASDEVLAGLTSLKDTSLSPRSHVRNVKPLGSSTTQLSRAVIDDAIAVRTWVLSLRHTEVCRERLEFVQNIVSQAAKLPHLPSPQRTPSSALPNSSEASPSHLGQLMIRVQTLSSKLFPHIEVLSKYDHVVSDRMPTSPEGGGRLRTIPEVLQALNDLSSIPVLSIAEEKLALRLDVLQWIEKAQADLANRNPSYHDVVTLKESLDQLLDGASPTRLRLVGALQPNIEADTVIRDFARSDVAALCGDTASTVNSLYASSTEWKDRADAVIGSLRSHGNTSAGKPVGNAFKLPAMVDLKRISDLLLENEDLGVALPKQHPSVLVEVLEEANKWTASTEKVILDAKDPLDSLPLLMSARETRPKGVLMDPARHVVDCWIDVLDWHRRLKLSLEDLPSSTSDILDDASFEKDFAKVELNAVYLLLAEGIELIELFSHSLKDGSIRVSSGELASLMSEMQLTQRPVRVISRSKLESSPPGRKIVGFLCSSKIDEAHGSPLLCLVFIVWRLRVLDFVRRYTDLLASSSDHAQMPTLQEAKQLIALRPQLPDAPQDCDTVGHQHIDYLQGILTATQTSEVAKFEQLIGMGDTAEQQARALLQSLKKLFRESSQKEDVVCDHLTKLKALLAAFKSKDQLVLNRDIEDTLDRTVRDLGWLVRTFSYEALHLDEVSFARSEGRSDNDKAIGSEAPVSPTNHEKKVPWDVLVSLYERIPVDSELGEASIGGYYARVALRVRELHEAANAWQEEVSTLMSISFRGLKRRAPTSGGITSPQRPTRTSAESESQPTVDFRTLDRLSRDPILSTVSMPRQAAVVEIVQKAREFELRQGDLLDKDYEGGAPDRARLPKVGSLVGKSGAFPLYRLTGSGLYASLQDSLKSMAAVGSEVLAETPGKTTFVFITKAVSWIDRLHRSVTNHSPFDEIAVKKLVIPSRDAKQLLQEGQALFLDVPEDVRKTLSKHKISLSTNKQTERLTVVIGKGGAHHSLGGTVLRWCPFLLGSLKADVSKLSAWEASVIATAQAVKGVMGISVSGQSGDPDATYQWFRLREKLDFILEEGRDSLIVAPEPAFLKTVLELKNALDNWANKTFCIPNGSIDVDSLFARRYEDGTAVVEDRFVFLDSLLGRSRAYGNEKKRSDDSSDVAATGPGSFRDKTRALLERAFQKGMQMAGIDGDDLKAPDSTIEAYCAIKARELERVIHSRMQGKSAGKAMSSGYRDKVRSLRYNLEDIKNPTLCARVLLGSISLESLVTMSSEQLASKDLKRTRAKVQEESTKNVVIAPAPKKSATATKAAGEPRGEPVKGKNIGTVAHILKTSVKSLPPAVKKTRTTSPVPSPAMYIGTPRASNASLSPKSSGTPGTPNVPLEVGPTRKGKTPDSASPRFVSPPSLNRLLKSVAPPPVAAPAPPSPPRIPPPPLESYQSDDSIPFADDAAFAQAPVRALLKSSSGGDRFSFNMSNPKVSFMAGLYMDGASDVGLNRLLPEVLTDKGRLKIDEFSRFISGKLSGGRWRAGTLRLLTFSDLDAFEYKKFYKDYEKRKRIAMFSIGKETKLFLVTPLFHGAARHLCESFSSSTSTYAVVLTRN